MDNKNRILIISAVFPPEPVVSAKLSFDLANLLSNDNDVIVLSPKPTRPFGYKFIDNNCISKINFEHIQLNSYTCPKSKIWGRFKESYSFGIHCMNYIKENNESISLIYANTWPLFAQNFTVKIARKYKIPIVIHVQDIYPESFINRTHLLGETLKLFLLPIDKYILRNASWVITISEKMKHYLVRTRKLNDCKVNVVQNWQNEEEFLSFNDEYKDKKNKRDGFTFMYLGNIGPVAGVDILIESFAKVKQENCRLVIAGSGSMKEFLQKKVANKGLNNVEFWSVSEGKVPEIQSYADVLILPIKKGAASSSIPSKLPAYMFSKKPIIACVDAYSDTANAIRESDCGWILPAENIEILTKMMNDVVKLPNEILSEKGNNGFNFAMRNFSKKNNLDKLNNIINKIIKNEL